MWMNFELFSLSLKTSTMIRCVCVQVGELYSIFQLTDVSSFCHLQNAVLRRFGIPIKKQTFCYQKKTLTNFGYYQLYWNQPDDKTIDLILLGGIYSNIVHQKRTSALGLKKILIKENVNNVLEYEPDSTSTVEDVINKVLLQQEKQSDLYILYRDLIILNSACLLIDLVLDSKDNIENDIIFDVVEKHSEISYYSLKCINKEMDRPAIIQLLNCEIREKLIRNYFKTLSAEQISMDPIAITVHGNPSLFRYTINKISGNHSPIHFTVIIYKETTQFEDFSKVYINAIFENKANDRVLMVAESNNTSKVFQEAPSKSLEKVTVQFLTFEITIDILKENVKTVDCIKRYIWKTKGVSMNLLKLFHGQVEMNGNWELSDWAVPNITLTAIAEAPKRVILNLVGVRGTKREFLFHDRKVSMLETNTIQDLKEEISRHYDILESELVIEDGRFADSFQLWETELYRICVAWNGTYQNPDALQPAKNPERLPYHTLEIQSKKCTLI